MYSTSRNLVFYAGFFFIISCDALKDSPFIIGAHSRSLLYSNYSVHSIHQLMDPDKAKPFSRRGWDTMAGRDRSDDEREGRAMFTFERGFMGLCRRFTVVLILLLLLSPFVTVSQQHDNTVDDNDCHFCIAMNNQTAAGPLAVAFDGTPLFTETRFVASAPVLTDIISLSSHGTRGPPA